MADSISDIKLEASRDQEVSDVDVLDIVETFQFTHVEEVCIRLGLTHVDIQNAKLSDIHSPKKQAMNILNLWRNRKGKKATRRTLIEAMEMCPDCTASVQTLKIKWNMNPLTPGKKRTKEETHPVVNEPSFDGPSTSKRMKRTEETHPVANEPCDPRSFPENLKVFREDLKEYYQDEMGQLPLLPWLEEYHEMKPIGDIFVDLEMATKERGDKVPKKLEKYEDLVTLKHPTKKDKFATRVLVLGEAGSGKTSLLSKIAYSWSQDHPSLAKYELVFHLRMRNLHSCNSAKHYCLRKGASGEEHNCSLIDEVFRQIPETSIDVHTLRNYITSNQDKILILLDGWDESVLDHVYPEKQSEHDIENLLISKKQPSSCVIVTSRPHKSLGKVQAKYIAVKLTGFSEKSVKEYIRKFFQVERSDRKDLEVASDNVSDEKSESEIIGGKCGKERGETDQGELKGEALALYNHLKTSDTLVNLTKIPVMLMLICWMWREKKNLPEQQTKLYLKFVRAIWDRYCDKHKYRGDEHNELMIIGEIAFIGIKDKRLVFKKSEFSEDKTGLNLGFLIEEKHIVDFRIEKSISFFHKSFQEYCAAYFLVNMPDKLRIFVESLDSWDAVLSKQEVLLFCCGLLCSKFPGIDTAINAAINMIKHAIARCVENGTKNNFDGIDVGDGLYIKAAKYNILPLLKLLNECGHLKHKDLIQPFRDLIMFNKLSINNDHPQTRQIFHTFLTLYGSSLCNIQAITCDNQTGASLDVISDTLRCMPNVSDVFTLFSFDETGEASETSMARFGESIAALSKLSIFKVWHAYDSLDISVILTHLSQSRSKALKHIDFTATDVGDAISHMGGIISHLDYLELESAGLEDRHISELCDILPNATCLEELHLTGNPIGNNALHTLFANIHHCAKLTRLSIDATIDCPCSPLIKECVTAGSRRYDNKDISWDLSAILLTHVYEGDATRSLLNISRNAATKSSDSQKPTQT